MLQFSDILREYRELMEKNVRNAIRLQKLASETATVDANGNWQFTIFQKNDTTSEIMTLNVSKNNVHVFAPENAVTNKTLGLAREAVLDQNMDFKSSGKNKYEYFVGLNPKDRQNFDNKVNQYIVDNPSLKFEATKELLIANGVMPKIVNLVLQRSADTAQKKGVVNQAEISARDDNGYCTKSLFVPLYEFKYRYGGFEWLPNSVEVAAHPKTMIDHIQTHCPNRVSEIVNLNSEIKNYEAGAVVMVDQGNGHMHAMMYNGSNKNTGKPEYVGFNSNDLNRNISDKRVGRIIDIPQMIKNDFTNGKIAERRIEKEFVEKSEETTINLESKESNKNFDQLSRGEKTEYISLNISRVREKRATMSSNSDTQAHRTISELRGITSSAQTPSKPKQTNVDMNTLNVYQISKQNG